MAWKVNIAQKLALFDEQWKPKIIASYNGNDVMVVKLKGPFQWHSHPDTDDFFFVIKGKLTIKLRSELRTLVIRTGPLNRKNSFSALPMGRVICRAPLSMVVAPSYEMNRPSAAEARITCKAGGTKRA